MAIRKQIDLNERRKKIGLTLEMFGKRLGISRQSAHQLSKAVLSGSVTLSRLEAAADALDCDLEVRLVPRSDRNVLERVIHTMALEGQNLTPEQVERLRRSPS